MSLDDPVVITCAISGVIASRDQCPAIPYTPEEYAAEARRIVDEGGVHIHIHARKPDGTPSYEVEDFVAIRDAIRAEVGDAAIINFSTGTMGVPVAKRIAYLEAGRPEVAALNMGSMNYAKYSRNAQGLRVQVRVRELVRRDHRAAGGDAALGIKPEHECFDLGHVGSLDPLLDMGVLERPAARELRDGGGGGRTRDRAQRRGDGRQLARRRQPLGRDRRRARAVDACGGRADPGRFGQGRAGGQLLPARRPDGPFKRRPRSPRRDRWSRMRAGGWGA